LQKGGAGVLRRPLICPHNLTDFSPILIMTYSLLPLRDLLPHEEVSAEHLQELLEELHRDGMLQRAIIVDTESRVILDGHHRWHAAGLLGLARIPAHLVDLWDDAIGVESFREGIPVSKALVIERGTSGIPLPWKTTRHVFGHNRIPIADAFAPIRLPFTALQ